ncbi:MAG TPA: sialidase family protein, partial [Acidobacteriaceae bacterium]|nr:sialidase family protein [Acidobacteriaceae bacterium]
MNPRLCTSRFLLLGLLFSNVLAFAVAPDQESPRIPGIHRLAWLPPGPNNPRNSEGAFLALRDGRLFFAYSRFEGSDGGDFGHATIAGRYSADGGRTWSAQDVPVVQKEGAMNVMSVSLLRLKD